MFDELNDELDKAFWLPTRINELTHSGIQNVAHKMVPLLPPLQQNRIHNVIESALIKEFDTLSDDEIKLFKKEAESFTDTKSIILIVFRNQSGHVYRHSAFSDVIKALCALVAHTGKTLQECVQFFQCRGSFQYVDYKTFICIKIIRLD